MVAVDGLVDVGAAEGVEGDAERAADGGVVRFERERDLEVFRGVVEAPPISKAPTTTSFCSLNGWSQLT